MIYVTPLFKTGYPIGYTDYKIELFVTFIMLIQTLFQIFLQLNAL